MTFPADLTNLSVTEVTAAIDADSLTPLDLFHALSARIETYEPAIHAYLRYDLNAAETLARQATDRARKGQRLSPLDGLPFGVKDNVYTTRFATTAASAVPQTHNPALNATLVTKLEAQGAILIGKCNTWEYGTGTGHVRFDLPMPPAVNPWKTQHYTGGSSSGSAAAVAAGLASFAIGTDSGGSVRLPAAGCGVVGFKPTFGRISRHGIMPNTWSFDTPGPICATVADAALIYDAIAGYDAADPSSLDAKAPNTTANLGAGLAGRRVGVVRNLAGPNGLPDAAILAALSQAEAALKAQGAQIVDVEMPVAPSEFRAIAGILNWSECFTIHEADYQHHRHLMGRALREKLEAGMYVRAVDYLSAARERRRLVAAVDALFGQVDVLLLPITYRTAPHLHDTEAVRDFTTGSAGSAFSLTGHPAISVPAGLDADGLPVAVQLAAGFCQDALLLQAAQALETALDWRPCRAPLTSEVAL